MATGVYGFRNLAEREQHCRSGERVHPLPRDEHSHELEAGLRFVLKISLAVGLLAGALEAAYAILTIHPQWGRSVVSAQRPLTTQIAIDPRVVDRIAVALPANARYQFAESARLKRSEVGSTFHAFLRVRLLPRVEVTHAMHGWRISWGLPLRNGCCRVLVNVGRPRPGSPSVYLVKRG